MKPSARAEALKGEGEGGNAGKQAASFTPRPSRFLKIAFFVGSFPVVSETFILRQITGLLALGHEVHIFADTRGSVDEPRHPEVAEQKLLERATFMELPPECAPWELPAWPLAGKTWIPGEERPISNFARTLRAVPVFLRTLAAAPRLAINSLRPAEYGFQAKSLSVLYRLAKLIEGGQKYDVLHAHFGPIGNSFRFVRELWRAPLIVSFHGYDFSTIPRKQGADVYRKLFGTADLITVNSNFTRSRVQALGCPAEKIRKLPVGLNPDDFPFRERVLRPAEPVRILSIGRLTPIKGHKFAIEAMAALKLKHPNIRYDIVGDGPLRSELEQLIQHHALKDRVTLHGALAGSALRRITESAHIFLLPSVGIEGDQEGQGLVLQEAQAAGLPVIATEHGALPEGMLCGQSGYLVPERDIKALVERLGFLLNHPETWPTLGRNGRQFAETHFNVGKLNEELVNIYNHAVSGFGPSSQR